MKEIILEVIGNGALLIIVFAAAIFISIIFKIIKDACSKRS